MSKTLFLNRRFYLVCFFALSLTIGWFLDKLETSDYMIAMGSLLLLYSDKAYQAIFGKSDANAD